MPGFLHLRVYPLYVSHFATSCRYSWVLSFATISGHLMLFVLFISIFRSRSVSSADYFTFACLTRVGMSAIIVLNSSGMRILPCGTPFSRDTCLEVCSSTLTNELLLTKKRDD